MRSWSWSKRIFVQAVSIGTVNVTDKRGAVDVVGSKIVCVRFFSGASRERNGIGFTLCIVAFMGVGWYRMDESL